MLDPYVRPAVDRFFQVSKPFLLKLPISANMVTLCGAVLIPVIVVLIMSGEFLLALGFIALNRFLDGLDGALARIQGATDFGGYADIVADFLFYASIPLAFALHDSQVNALASVLLLASFIASGSSFLAYAIIAAKRGIETTARGQKSFFHLGGLMEGSETIAFCVLVCLLPEYYVGLALGFAFLCALSSLGRIILAWRDFSA